MTQKTITPSELHADHRHWSSELSMWQDDIEFWRSEFEQALRDLKEIEAMLATHGEHIAKHERRFNVISDALEFHERTLRESLRGGSDPDLDDALLERHDEQSDAISTQRNLHEQIKKHHHTIVAHVALLRSALDAALQEKA